MKSVESRRSNQIQEVESDPSSWVVDYNCWVVWVVDFTGDVGKPGS